MLFKNKNSNNFNSNKTGFNIKTFVIQQNDTLIDRFFKRIFHLLILILGINEDLPMFTINLRYIIIHPNDSLIYGFSKRG